jgi:hypothetical protein
MSEISRGTKASQDTEGAKTPKLAALASWIGSAVEYYDFFIYGMARSPDSL